MRARLVLHLSAGQRGLWGVVAARHSARGKSCVSCAAVASLGSAGNAAAPERGRAHECRRGPELVAPAEVIPPNLRFASQRPAGARPVNIGGTPRAAVSADRARR